MCGYIWRLCSSLEYIIIYDHLRRPLRWLPAGPLLFQALRYLPTGATVAGLRKQLTQPKRDYVLIPACRVRLSDGSTFFDAALIGPYELANNKIRVSPFTAYHGTMEFARYVIVKVVDFFSKIDPTKICRLKMMIRKIVQLRVSDKKLGRPQELAFYMQVNNLVNDSDVVIQSPPDDPPPCLPVANEVEIKIYEDDLRPAQISLSGSGVRP